MKKDVRNCGHGTETLGGNLSEEVSFLSMKDRCQSEAKAARACHPPLRNASHPSCNPKTASQMPFSSSRLVLLFI